MIPTRNSPPANAGSIGAGGIEQVDRTPSARSKRSTAAALPSRICRRGFVAKDFT